MDLRATIDGLVEALQAPGGPRFERAAPLGKRTWWRVGGVADLLVDCADRRQLHRLLQAIPEGCPLFVLGNASNILVADAGIRGVVLRLTGELAGCRVEGDRLVAGGGHKLTVLVSRALRHGWTGLEFFAGIPGTVGGAVKMNAGNALGEVVDALIDVELARPGPVFERRRAEDLALAYRSSAIEDREIVVEARFRLTADDPEASRRTVEAHLARRAATQPVDRPSCGSTFRNPPGDHAGRLIEAAGLKGFRIGGALVSPKHANFIVNDGGATAAEIRALIEHVRQEVLERFGVRLVREVRYVGDWGDGLS